MNSVVRDSLIAVTFSANALACGAGDTADLSVIPEVNLAALDSSDANGPEDWLGARIVSNECETISLELGIDSTPGPIPIFENTVVDSARFSGAFPGEPSNVVSSGGDKAVEVSFDNPTDTVDSEDNVEPGDYSNYVWYVSAGVEGEPVETDRLLTVIEGVSDLIVDVCPVASSAEYYQKAQRIGVQTNSATGVVCEVISEAEQRCTSSTSIDDQPLKLAS